MKYSFAGKVIVITGGSGGIGAHLARDFAEKGATIVLISRNEVKLASIINSLQGQNHLYIAMDLTDRDAIKSAIQTISLKYGKIDVLIPNAAITTTDRFDVRSVESIEEELDINLVAPLVFIRSAIPLLRASDDPRIITTGSLGGIFPLGETPMYTASKFGLRGAMLSMSLDLAGKGITAGSVLPSATDTPMLHKEAIEGGNSLQFMDPPQSTETVVKSFIKMLDKPRFEIYPKRSESWLVKIALLIPNQLPRLMPLFRGSGEKGHKKYLKELETRGIARKNGDAWEYLE
ncbi:MAG: SDR family oxidoreductase [Actinomycetes bacterium]|jgi:short-subunit dehydrogenase